MRVHYFAEEAALGEDHRDATVYGSCDDPVWTSTDKLLIRLADEVEDTECSLRGARLIQGKTIGMDKKSRPKTPTALPLTAAWGRLPPRASEQ
jgi:hypothetical protein